LSAAAGERSHAHGQQLEDVWVVQRSQGGDLAAHLIDDSGLVVPLFLRSLLRRDSPVQAVLLGDEQIVASGEDKRVVRFDSNVLAAVQTLSHHPKAAMRHLLPDEEVSAFRNSEAMCFLVPSHACRTESAELHHLGKRLSEAASAQKLESTSTGTYYEPAARHHVDQMRAD
jgi:hypothetical protein